MPTQQAAHKIGQLSIAFEMLSPCILDEIETALKFAQTMTWKGKHPNVKLINETYEKKVKLTKKAREEIEEKIERLTESTNQDFPNLGQWFIDIYYDTT